MLNAEVPVFECNDSTLHMFSELAEKGQLPSLISK